jgi:hypothetical protein
LIYQLYFTPPVCDKYDYWVSLMTHYLSRSDLLEIHCWNEEREVLEELASLLENPYEKVIETNLTIFKMKTMPDVVNHLLTDNIGREGEIKWFSIFLSKNNKTIFHSEHWGTEFFAPDVNEEDIEFITSVMPEGTNFHQYQASEVDLTWETEE